MALKQAAGGAGSPCIDDCSLATEAEYDEGCAPTPLEYSVDTIPMDYTLWELYGKWLNRDISIPRLERPYPWTEAQASRLIESFIMDLPVPPVFMFTCDDGRSVVIDGMRRLRTVFSYFGGSHPETGSLAGQRFRIVGINEESRLHGRTFPELAEEDQCRLKDAVLRAMLVRRRGAGGGGSAMYEICERLNSGSTRLEPQEVRSRAYGGGLDDLLDEINRDESWRAMLGRPRPDPAMRDREIVLRCIALFHEGDEYAGPMKGFLSGFMARHRSPGERFLAEERRRFKTACSAALAALGPAPFNNGNGQLRAPLLDSVIVAFARSCGAAPGAGRAGPVSMRGRLEALRSDKRFAEYAGPSSTTAGAVRGRLRLAQEIMFGGSGGSRSGGAAAEAPPG